MPSPCDTCAFNRTGTGGAADETTNRLKGEICVLGPIPFWCHHTKSGEEWNWKESTSVLDVKDPTDRKVCGGWQKRVQAAAAKGEYNPPEIRPYQKHLALLALSSLDNILKKPEGYDKATEFANLKDALKALKGIE